MHGQRAGVNSRSLCQASVGSSEHNEKFTSLPPRSTRGKTEPRRLPQGSLRRAQSNSLAFPKYACLGNQEKPTNKGCDEHTWNPNVSTPRGRCSRWVEPAQQCSYRTELSHGSFKRLDIFCISTLQGLDRCKSCT